MLTSRRNHSFRGFKKSKERMFSAPRADKSCCKNCAPRTRVEREELEPRPPRHRKPLRHKESCNGRSKQKNKGTTCCNAQLSQSLGLHLMRFCICSLLPALLRFQRGTPEKKTLQKSNFGGETLHLMGIYTLENMPWVTSEEIFLQRGW